MPYQKSADWLSWIVGGLAVVAVIFAALRFAEMEALLRLLLEAAPRWLVVAVVLQAFSYATEGEIWCRVGRAARFPIPRITAFRLSLVKLFVDQTIPSAGLSGTLVVARALGRLGMPRRSITAGIVIRIVSYYAAFVVCLGVALAIAVLHGQANRLILSVSIFFVAFAMLFSLGVLAIAGHHAGPWIQSVTRFAHLHQVVDLLQNADRRLVRDRTLLMQSGLLQLGIVALDAATVWVLIRALGVNASPPGVFASFMLSTLFRSIGILPGGLGSFEAVSVLTLKLVGVPLPVALTATLLFRALSFWLPMAPGFWYSRHVLVREREAAPSQAIAAYWSLAPEVLSQRLDSTGAGLSGGEARRRLRSYGRNELREQRPVTRLNVLFAQLRNPLLLVLVLAAAIAMLTGELGDAVIVLVIVAATIGIGYTREYRAQSAASVLRARLKTQVRVWRDGRTITIAIEEVVPGDVVLLVAGSLVPADAIVLEATDCFVSEAVLTGESFPVQKRAGCIAPDTPLAQRSNCVFLGTNVRSGTARCLVVGTGLATEFGQVARRLTLRPPETEFDRGLSRFGYLLTTMMLVIVLLVFVAHVMEGRPPMATLLFAVALAVGLSPELLPAILSVNLARGASAMAARGVLVRHLNAIENLGCMDILCTDKTGTITEGVVRLGGAYDSAGREAPHVLELAAINAALESGINNPLDEAIEQACQPDLSAIRKLAEIPFDFVHKRVSVVVTHGLGVRLVTKGAFHQVAEICTTLTDGTPLDAARRAEFEARFSDWSGEGIRVLAVASRDLDAQATYSRDDERDMCFVGFLTFLDRPKAGVDQAIADLSRLGVTVKMISGDGKLVTEHVAREVGLRVDRVLTGADLDSLQDEALWREAERTDVFAEVDPNQKERIILALKKMGHVVGFLGDGVNDAPAMHAADTSLSVEQATDVAREAADFVLLDRDLEVIRQGILEGRKTFANTLKYILTTASANLGNMVSMAVASLYLPFLPLLAGQILINNLVSDIPAVGIADDAVDHELIDRPRRWDTRFIGRFMVEFGVLSTVFDFLTFGALLGVFHAQPDEFRTGWFVESLLTELVIALVVRTRRPCYRSRPGTVLLVSTVVLIVIAFAVPYLPYAQLLGFVPLPGSLLLCLAGITALYVFAAELTKRWFYRGVP